jgi:lipoprotein-anchoring transpeptidase ErfK/SrfK
MRANDLDEQRAEFVVRYGLTSATWDPHSGDLVAVTRPAPVAVPRPAQPAQPTAMPSGAAARVADAFAARLKRDHETRFAASHFKPKLDAPKAEDDVPRAVRARSASDGRPSPKQRRR